MSKVLEYLQFSVRKLLRESGRSQSELAKDLGMTPQAISDLLNSRHTPRLDRLEPIAEALKVTPAFLIASPDEQRLLKAEPGATRSLESRPPDQIPAQEKLQSAAALLSDAEASILLSVAEGLLLERSVSELKKRSG